jgi:hypothetical protein
MDRRTFNRSLLSAALIAPYSAQIVRAAMRQWSVGTLQ